MLKRAKKHPPGEINAGSMADIAFLLLIFFLVTTTMDTDVGIMRLLPPVVEDEQEKIEIIERNVYVVLINDADMLQVEGEPMELSELRAGAKEFMANPNNLSNLPEKKLITKEMARQEIANFTQYAQSEADPDLRSSYVKTKERWEERLAAVDKLGEYMELPSSAVISLQTGSKTSYDMYVQVQNELEAGIRELRDELAMDKFGRRFTDLDDKVEEDQNLIKAIRMVYPQRISEAEPVEVGRRE